MTTRIRVIVEHTNCETEKVLIAYAYKGVLNSAQLHGAGASVEFHVAGDCKLLVREATSQDVADRE